MFKEIKAKRITVKNKDGEVVFDFKVGKEFKSLWYTEKQDPLNFGSIRLVYFTEEDGMNPLWKMITLGTDDTVDIEEA